MNIRLHLFGDSYTQGHLLDTTFKPYHEWKEYIKKDLPPTWGDILQQKLKCIINNNAVAGMSNPEIFQSICNHSDEFNANDIVIVNWTFNHRFRWVVWNEHEKKFHWKRFSANKEDGKYIKEIVREEIAMNRSHPLHIQEIYNYQKILTEYSKSKKFYLFFWSADLDIINNLPDEELKDDRYILHDEISKLPPFNSNNQKIKTFFDVIFKYGGKTIEQETDDKILNGYHLGESGHRVQGELFYKYLLKYTNISII